MMHCYETGVAEKYGITCAVLLYNLFFWVEKNKHNGINYHEDRYWTYNTIEAFTKQFPELSESTIKRSLKKMEEEGLIVKGDFNEKSFDRTGWYSLTKMAYSMMSICTNPLGQNDTMESAKMNQTIPDKYTDIYTDREIDKSISMSDSQSLTAQIRHVMAEWNEMANKTGIPAVVRIQLNSNRHKWLKARLAEYGEDSILDAIANVQASEYLRNTTYFSFDWFIRPNNFIKVLEGNYGKGKREKPKEDHPEPETKEIVKDDEYYNNMSDEEYMKYFEETYGNDD